MLRKKRNKPVYGCVIVELKNSETDEIVGYARHAVGTDGQYDPDLILYLRDGHTVTNAELQELDNEPYLHLLFESAEEATEDGWRRWQERLLLADALDEPVPLARPEDLSPEFAEAVEWLTKKGITVHSMEPVGLKDIHGEPREWAA